MMIKQLMIHTLLSEVVKGTLGHMSCKTACDCTAVAAVDSHPFHLVAQPLPFIHDNRETHPGSLFINAGVP